MTKISPPPWTFDEQHRVIYDQRHDFPIIALHGRLWKENGVLAAAAPDLQVALRDLIKAIEQAESLPMTFGDVDLEPELTGARAALARSEGK